MPDDSEFDAYLVKKKESLANGILRNFGLMQNGQATDGDYEFEEDDGGRSRRAFINIESTANSDFKFDISSASSNRTVTVAAKATGLMESGAVIEDGRFQAHANATSHACGDVKTSYGSSSGCVDAETSIHMEVRRSYKNELQMFGSELGEVICGRSISVIAEVERGSTASNNQTVSSHAKLSAFVIGNRSRLIRIFLKKEESLTMGSASGITHRASVFLTAVITMH